MSSGRRPAGAHRPDKEGAGFTLADCPAAQAWLGRAADVPGYVTMDA